MIRVLRGKGTLHIWCSTRGRYYSGNVKSFNNKKGFGFIHPEFDLQNDIINHYGSWKDVFIHYTDIEDDVRLLLPTNKVEFDCVFDSNGPVAKRLKKVIPKRKQMVIEKWQDAPEEIDQLVQKKDSIPVEEWSSFLSSFYRKIAEHSSNSSKRYQESKIVVPEEQKNHLEYLDMANDLLSGLSQTDMYDNTKKHS